MPGRSTSMATGGRIYTVRQNSAVVPLTALTPKQAKKKMIFCDTGPKIQVQYSVLSKAMTRAFIKPL